MSAPIDPIERRSFLKLMAASMAMAGMAGCTRQPAEQIVPYVRQPEEIVPDLPDSETATADEDSAIEDEALDPAEEPVEAEAAEEPEPDPPTPQAKATAPVKRRTQRRR